MLESRNNDEAILLYLYYYLQQFIIITSWKPNEVGKNGIRAGSRLDLLWYIQGVEPFILWPVATTGYYGAPESSTDLLCDGWVLVVDHCIFFWSTNRLLRENVTVCCWYSAVMSGRNTKYCLFLWMLWEL